LSGFIGYCWLPDTPVRVSRSLDWEREHRAHLRPGDDGLHDIVDGTLWKDMISGSDIAMGLGIDAFQPEKGKYTGNYSVLPCNVTVLNLSPDDRHRPEATWFLWIAPGLSQRCALGLVALAGHV
jgi:hypothetical protein